MSRWVNIGREMGCCNENLSRTSRFLKALELDTAAEAQIAQIAANALPPRPISSRAGKLAWICARSRASLKPAEFQHPLAAHCYRSAPPVHLAPHLPASFACSSWHSPPPTSVAAHRWECTYARVRERVNRTLPPSQSPTNLRPPRFRTISAFSGARLRRKNDQGKP
jgi:hypothetical protein